MSEIATITREDFERALNVMAQDNNWFGLYEAYTHAPEHMRPTIGKAILTMFQRINSNLDMPEDFRYYVSMEIGYENDKVNGILKNYELPKELFVELAIISACDTVYHATEYLERKDLTDNDRKRILKAAMYGIRRDARVGWVDHISGLLYEKMLTEKQHKLVCKAILDGLKVQEVDGRSKYDLSGDVLLNENVPVEIRRKAMERCALNGGFMYLVDAMKTKDADLIFDGKLEQWLWTSVVCVEEYFEGEKVGMIFQASTNEDELPKVVRELMPSALESLLQKSDDALDFCLEMIDGMEVSESIRQMVEGIQQESDEECKHVPSPQSKKQKPKNTKSLKTALAYLEQLGDNGHLMEPPKMKTPGKGKEKPKIKI